MYMTALFRSTTFIRKLVFSAGLLIGYSLLPGAALATDGIDPGADKILRSMSDYLGGLSTFSMKADIDNEIIDMEGQKLQFSSSAEFVVARPAKFHVLRKGAFADVEFIFDGKAVTLYGKNANAYLQFEGPKTIDEATRALGFETGLDMPGVEFLDADPYAGLVSNVTSSEYLGTVYVSGIECHYLTFRAARVDWQLWVATGDKPLPMKYVITSKWVTAAPQYSIRFRGWDTDPEIAAGSFKFSASKGVRKLDSFPVNLLGEIMPEGSK